MLERVDGRGRRIEHPRTTRMHLANTRTLRSKVTGFRLPAAPAFYRISIRILGASGQELGHFGEYVRVMQPRVRADLRGEAPSYAAGELAHFKVVNLGTRVVSYGLGLTVEVFNGVTWELANVFPVQRVPRKAIALEAGATGACEGLPIPTDAPLGRYRVVKLVVPLEGHPRSVTALFEISAKRSD
jgi:hypothetical protein